VYLYQYHDQQIELHPLLPWTGIIPIQYVPAAYLPGGSIAATTPYQPIVDVNGGNSRYEGLELQATYQFTARDQVRLEAAYNHAVYGSLVVDTTGGPPGTAYSSPDFDLSGQQEAHAPLWNGSLAYQHIWDVAGGTLTFNGRSRLQTRSYTTIQEWFANGQTIQPGYHVTDLDLRFTSADGHWSAGPWVKNLENKAVVTYVYPLYKETLDIGRTYGVNVSLKY
jgi:iron complex outermembrane receptor protein